MSYTKFIILGQERTGSNFLQLSLASHPNVFSVGEVFNPSEEIRKKNKKVARPIRLDEDPAQYLEQYVYKEHPDQIKAVGFRLFYSHARNDEWKAVWEYLRRDKVKVIHLKRKNLLDRYLSMQLAARSNQWIAFKKDDDTKFTEPITLDPQDCFQNFQWSLQQQEKMDNFFKDNPKTEVIYENLSADLTGESKRIQAFLGVEFQPLSVKTVKQRTRKKSEIIMNYDNLKQHVIRGLEKGWAKEEWLDFFDDN